MPEIEGAGTMKLFYFDRILCDHTCGIGVVLAHDLAEARMLLMQTQAIGHCWYEDELSNVQEFDLDTPRAFACYGGG